MKKKMTKEQINNLSVFEKEAETLWEAKGGATVAKLVLLNERQLTPKEIWILGYMAGRYCGSKQ